MEETGKVIDVFDNMAKVLVSRCTACGDCGACYVSKDSLNMILTMDNEIEADIGDEVIIELNTENFLSASLILYGIPLLGLVLGIVLGYYIFHNLGYDDSITQLIAFAFGIIFLAISYFLIKRRESRIREMERFRPKLVKIIKKTND